MGDRKIKFIVNLAFALVCIICLGYILVLGQSIIAPFFLAFLLALLFQPFANFLEMKLHFPRLASTLCSVLIIIVIIGGVGFFFATQLSDFTQDLPQLKDQFTDVFHALQTWIRDTFHVNINKQFEYINEGINKMLSSSGVILKVTLGGFSSSLGFFSFCILFFIFILSYRGVLYDFIVHVFEKRHEKQVIMTVAAIRKMTKSYLIGVCIQIVIVMILSAGLLSVLGVKYAILLGVLTGILNIIPYLGIAMSLALACLFTFATATPITCLYVIIGYLIIHSIDGNIILPFIVGSKVKINALFTFIGILVGASLWGISGMFLCIPALAILKIILERVEGAQPWGNVLGEGSKSSKKKRKMRISKKITLEEKD